MYLDSIGVAENRFTDLMVDFTDTSGEPTDTIVWLRNGAGKTTMLSLLLALILPSRTDFLATRTKNRTLEDLVLAGDTAHVVAEWVSPEGELLLTGAVYEWDGRSRPHDYNGRGKEKLRRSWWCVHPDPVVDGATLDTLPFTLRSGGAYDRERFCAHVRNLTADGINTVVASTYIHEWHTALRERRFDPDLFRYFAEVNSAEGGMDGLFNDIDSPGRFVRYLLRFVGDQQRVAPVRDLLADTAVEIAKRPIYTAQLRFCTDAVPKVAAFGEAHGQWLAATGRRNEVILRAAALKRALLETAAQAQQRSAIAADRAELLEGQLREVRAKIDSARNQRNEYLYNITEFDFADAEEAAKAAKAAAEEAEREVGAWAAVEQYAQLEQRKAERDAQASTLKTAAEGAFPLVERCNGAKQVLAAAIQIAIDKIGADIAELESVKESAAVERDTAEELRDRAVNVLAGLDAESERLRVQLTQFDDECQQMVTEGILNPDERLGDAENRLLTAQSTARTNRDQLHSQRDELAPQIESARTRNETARTELSTTRQKSDRLVSELHRLTTRAADLADNARLRLLLQTDTVDLGASSDDAVTQLTKAIAGDEKELVGLGEERARGERAIHSLTDFGLLPPRLGVETAIKALADQEITAVSGWRYLAEHIDRSEHERYLAEMPEVLDGVIVYGDSNHVAAAAHAIADADELIVIVSATTFADRYVPKTVVGPAAAQHDKAAGEAEMRQRTNHREVLQQQVETLTARRDADLASRSAISAWCDDLPPDGLGGLRSRVESAAAELGDAESEERLAADALSAVQNEAKQIEQQISALSEQLARLDGVLPRVRRAAVVEREQMAPSRIRLAAIPRDSDRARTTKEKEAERQKVAAGRVEQLGTDIRLATRLRNDLRAELEGLPEPTPICDLTIEAARTKLAVFEKQLREQFPESSLRQAVLTAEEEVTRAASAWNTNDDQTRCRAIELAATTAAADSAARSDARSRAAHVHTRAQSDLGVANERWRIARDRRAKAETERPRGIITADNPKNRDHATLLADAQADEMAVRESERHRVDGDRKSALAEAGLAENRGQMLNDQAALLRDIEAASASSTFVPDDNAEVRQRTRVMLDALSSASAVLNAAERARRERADELSRWAGTDEFAAVAEDEHGSAVRQLRDMFWDKGHLDRVADRIPELTDALEMRKSAIVQQLAQVEQHKDNVVVRMIDLVDDALSVLTRAATLSELPAGIGPWEHKRFLIVEARSRPSREQIGLRVGELIDAMVQARRIEADPAELLWRATEVAVPDGFRATILKPAPDQPTARIPVEEMRKWSGGENLTASLVLFCVLARLRAERRTGDRTGTAGGVLPLDNPVGKANYLPFLDLQRRVARACGVQLVFWTGLGDLGAVTTFPRIAALHKRPSATRPGRAYVLPDASNTQVLDIVSAVRNEP
ncbi:hypothetical protein [Nocardia sp. NPDC057030]|uniref:hypothetical protein n=1 Tax=unclassified Nocardia TaxID=2637762 RepID=UPI003624F117